MIMKTIKNYYKIIYCLLLYKIKEIKIIVVNSKMKRKKVKPIKIDYIDQVVDRCFFCLFKLGFSQ